MPETKPTAIDYGNLNRSEIRGLDQALYVASCFAGNSETREVVIMGKVVDGDEIYAVVDGVTEALETLGRRDMESEGWRKVYALKSFNREA
jgi:hypothetical protein